MSLVAMRDRNVYLKKKLPPFICHLPIVCRLCSNIPRFLLHLPSDLCKLQKGSRRQGHADSAIQTLTTASDKLHLETRLLHLQDTIVKGVHLHILKPIFSFCEPVSGGISPNVEVHKTVKGRNSILQQEISAKNAEDENTIKIAKWAILGARFTTQPAWVSKGKISLRKREIKH